VQCRNVLAKYSLYGTSDAYATKVSTSNSLDIVSGIPSLYFSRIPYDDQDYVVFSKKRQKGYFSDLRKRISTFMTVEPPKKK
jgi:hypothetical protein